MKTIGVLGGMSFESTIYYYRIINEEVNRRLGGLHSAKIMLSSLEFEEIRQLQQKNDWGKAAEILGSHAKKLQTAGAELIIVTTNTMHKIAREIAAAVTIPLLHIAAPTAAVIKKDGLKTVALIGTKFTMEHDFYTGYLEKEGLKVITPDEESRNIIHDIIFDELCKGIIKDESRKKYEKIINDLKRAGAQCVILGCTEICMLINKAELPVYDTTKIHALAAADAALK
ncbi:MAG: aspartate/glutamate racemase family protein [Elusimicrobium sp.]|jgi:aspartate racemase|nr:aspartate/glutamate racemase family protein [Elusimicrobium sp.]